MKKLLTSFALILCCMAGLFAGCSSGKTTPPDSGNTDGGNSGNQNAPVSITLSETNIEMFIGETHQLYAVVSPLDDNAKINWTSLNTKVVTVDNNGKVTALLNGTGVVRATTENNLVATCTVKVSQAVGSLTVDVTRREGLYADTVADTNAGVILIPENLESFPIDFQLSTYQDYTSYGIFSGRTDTTGKKTFNDIPVGKYRVIIQSNEVDYSASDVTNILRMTEAGEKIFNNIFGDTLYQKLQVLKDHFDDSGNSYYYLHIAGRVYLGMCYGETIEITNGATQSVSHRFATL